MMRIGFLSAAALLAMVAVSPQTAIAGGCCVCGDAQCHEGVMDMRSCAVLCREKQSDGRAYNEGGTCITQCSAVRKRMMIENILRERENGR